MTVVVRKKEARDTVNTRVGEPPASNDLGVD